MKRPQSYVRAAVVALAMAVSLPSFAADENTCPAQININKADAKQLDLCLPYINAKTSNAIVAYRVEHGDFKTVQDIAAVKGIGEKRAEKLAPKLTVK